jgi:hypothetical protein
MTATDISSGTVTGLMNFMDFMVQKGYGSHGAISPWKSAAKTVFQTVEGDDFTAFDVRTFNIDEYFARFETKSMGRYAADSLGAYRARFRKAVEAYRNYLADPNWKPSLRASASRRPAKDPQQRWARTPASPPASSAVPLVSAMPSPSMIAYPFPLKSGQMARLELPTQLERDDADRMAAFLRTLVFEQPRQLPSGEPDGE